MPSFRVFPGAARRSAGALDGVKTAAVIASALAVVACTSEPLATTAQYSLDQINAADGIDATEALVIARAYLDGCTHDRLHHAGRPEQLSGPDRWRVPVLVGDIAWVPSGDAIVIDASNGAISHRGAEYGDIKAALRACAGAV